MGKNSFDIEKCLAPIERPRLPEVNRRKNSFDIEKCLARFCLSVIIRFDGSKNSFDIEKCLALDERFAILQMPAK